MKKVWSTKKKICCGLLSVAVVILIGFIAKPKALDATDFQAVFEEEQTKEEVATGITDGIKIPGFKTISIAANQTNVSVNFENPEGNPCYFQISMYLKDTGELLYQSNLVKPGQHLYDIELVKALEAGSYDITLQYDTFSLDDSYTPLNGATSTCTLVVS